MLKTYLVRLHTPGGVLAIDVPSYYGPVAAARRAIVSLAATGTADLPDIKVESSIWVEDGSDAFIPDKPATLIELPGRFVCSAS